MVEFFSGLILSMIMIIIIEKHKTKTYDEKVVIIGTKNSTIFILYSLLIFAIILLVSVYNFNNDIYNSFTSYIYEIVHSSNFHIWVLGFISGIFLAILFNRFSDYSSASSEATRASLLRDAAMWGSPAAALFVLALLLSHGDVVGQAVKGVRTPIFEVEFSGVTGRGEGDAKHSLLIKNTIDSRKFDTSNTFSDFGLSQVDLLTLYVDRDAALISLHRAFHYAPASDIEKIKSDIDFYYEKYNEKELSSNDASRLNSINRKIDQVGWRNRVYKTLIEDLIRPLMSCMVEVDSELFYRRNMLVVLERISRNLRILKIHNYEKKEERIRQWESLIENILELQKSVKVDYEASEFRLTGEQRKRCEPVVRRSLNVRDVKERAKEAESRLAEARPYLAIISSAIAAMHREPLAGIAELDNWLEWATLEIPKLVPLDHQIAWEPATGRDSGGHENDAPVEVYWVNPDAPDVIDPSSGLDVSVLRVYSARAAWVQNHLIVHAVGLGELAPQVARRLIERNASIIKNNIPESEYSLILNEKTCLKASRVSRNQYISWLMARNLAIYYSTQDINIKEVSEKNLESYWIKKKKDANYLRSVEPWDCLTSNGELRIQYTQAIDHTFALAELRLADIRSKNGVLSKAEYVKLLRSIRLRMQEILGGMSPDTSSRLELDASFLSLASVVKDARSRDGSNHYRRLLELVDKELHRLGTQ
jgi:hypothetical protein